MSGSMVGSAGGRRAQHYGRAGRGPNPRRRSTTPGANAGPGARPGSVIGRRGFRQHPMVHERLSGVGGAGYLLGQEAERTGGLGVEGVVIEEQDPSTVDRQP